jgi:hypothetical protein
MPVGETLFKELTKPEVCLDFDKRVHAWRTRSRRARSALAARTRPKPSLPRVQDNSISRIRFSRR